MPPAAFRPRPLGLAASGFVAPGFLCLCAAAVAQAPPPDEPGPAPPAPAHGSPSAAAGTVRVHLMEGSVVSGTLSVDALTVRTAFGTLEVPVEHVVSFTPGLASHPQLEKRLGRLIQQLGSNDAAERDRAQRELADFGPAIRPRLEPFRADEDAERKSRVEKILEELENLEELEELEEEETAEAAVAAASLAAEDTVETDRFTVVGRISPESFRVETPFGPLTVALKDIRYVAREGSAKPETRSRLAVDATSLPQVGLKATGIRLERGDRLVITASGQIVMAPWGNNVVSGPDGAGQNVPVYTASIPSGALMARIGRGEEFLVGSRYDGTVKAGGTLFLGVAMTHQFANQGYTFPGSYDVRIRVNAADR